VVKDLKRLVTLKIIEELVKAVVRDKGDLMLV